MAFRFTAFIMTIQVMVGCTVFSRAAVCPVAMDTVFLLDGSSSIGSSSFEKLKDFIVQVLQDFRISQEETHIGVVLYSNNATTQLSFLSTQSSLSVAATIRAIPYSGGNTMTNIGLDVSHTLFSVANGGRADVPRAVIVINDGESNGVGSVPLSAQRIKNDDITVLSIGVGSAVSVEELHQIATSPDHVFRFTTPDDLINHVTRIARAICAVSRQSQLYFTSVSENTIMVDHVITNMHVTDDVDCAFKCLNNQGCFSFDYLTTTRTCQLNYSTKRASPDDVIDDDASVHYDMTFTTSKPNKALS